MLRFNYTCSLVISCVLLSGCSNDENKAKDNGKLNVRPAENAAVSTPVSVMEQSILFFGTSLTAGYGLDQNEAYPALIQKKIDSLDLPYKVVNGGLSGETSAAGKSRIDWLLKQRVAVFVLELGANDGLRGVPVSETTANLQSIINKVKKKYPQVKLVLTGMQVPPNMGDKYAADFKEMFKKLAEKNKMVYVPFLLEGVGGVPKLNQDDGIHPTAEGQKILAENVWVKLKDVL
jgi:acyl-CoA thioesterase-1